MDLSAPIIPLFYVRMPMPSTTTTLFPIIVKYCTLIVIVTVKRTNVNKKRAHIIMKEIDIRDVVGIVLLTSFKDLRFKPLSAHL